MRGPTPKRLRSFACRCLNLGGYFRRPGDGRVRPQILAGHLLWALLIGEILREGSFHAIEGLVRSRARRVLGVGRRFGDDALAYFTERLDVARTRQAIGEAIRRAKRNKAFDGVRFIGLALDGTGAARCTERRATCPWCVPFANADHEVIGHHHYFSLISIVGTGLVLPVDVEPYGPGDCEVNASERVLRRAVQILGPRFADYLVVDGEYARAPFLRGVADLGLHVVVRLKGNVPELYAAAQARFTHQAPSTTFEDDRDQVEIWDADDFDPWSTLNWPTVRVIRYRQHKPDGTIVEAYWLTDFPSASVGSRSVYRMAKSRWEIENGGFNDGKNRHGLEQIRHHHPNSLVVGWLIVCLALVLERLYRLRYLHRGGRRPPTAIELVRALRLSLGTRSAQDTS